MKDGRDSNSPILFLGISKAYLQAFEAIWNAKFSEVSRSEWDLALLFHPVSHLLGVSLETAMKGLLSCRGMHDLKKLKHDLNKIFALASDPALVADIDACLVDLVVPEEIFDANPDIPRIEVEALYRNHRFHMDMINRIYDHPYATRYPVLGGHSLPDPIALKRITLALQARLLPASRQWRPRAPTP